MDNPHRSWKTQEAKPTSRPSNACTRHGESTTAQALADLNPLRLKNVGVKSSHPHNIGGA
ncbi:MAG: hypothetical protein PT944_02880 [Actinomycetaceae bacterium]|nr:hypothetical protein [Arcanobacterium sp.]MDD7686848.1 hypothetical protein [Actinomycetaceae bacterium]MDY5274061.1 hypothetical protein [Arcanobacterium sp.]